MLVLRSLLIWALFSLAFTLPVQAQKLYYPRPEASFDERTGYPLQLLRLAFANSELLKHYELVPSEMLMPRGRSLKLVEKGLGVDIFWGIATAQRKADLHEVNFDIYKGLFGYRLLLIRENNKALFRGLNSRAIKKLVAGLSPDWPDYQILKNNGFNVQGTSSYANLFKLLEMNRVDYLPRSIFEVWPELEYQQNKGLIVASDVALHYPTKFNYFFGSNNTKLAEALTASLEQMSHDGSFNELFDLIWGDVIKRSALESKNIVEVNLSDSQKMR